MAREKLAEIVRRVDETGYRGDYSFEAFNDDYRTWPLPMVAERARRSVKWLTDRVSRRSLPPRHRACFPGGSARSAAGVRLAG